MKKSLLVFLFFSLFFLPVLAHPETLRAGGVVLNEHNTPVDDFVNGTNFFSGGGLVNLKKELKEIKEETNLILVE